jgi:hypothetical protein
MSKRWIKAGVENQTIDLFILDSSSTTGAGLTGLTSGSSGLTCYYRKGAFGTAQPLTLASQTVGGAHTDGGFVAIDGTNMPGLYRLDLSDTMVAAEGMLTILLKGATNMAPVVAELEIVDIDIYDSVRLGLTALPNAAAEASGGLATLSAAQSSNGTIPVNLKTIAGQTANAAAAVTFPASIGTSTLDAAGAADAVWDEILSGHLSTGSTGAALNAAGSSGDPWTTSLPGAYGTGTAGYIIGTNLDALVSTRMATFSLPSNFNLLSINLTGQVVASSVIGDVTLANNNVNANTVSDTAAQEIANAVWTANIAQSYAVGSVPAANWANNTFGDRVVISDSNNQNEVAITGSNHIAADIHEIQSDEIIDIAQGVLTEATSTNTATYAVGDVGNVLGRLVNMIAADGADFQFTANALELAPSGGGGGGTTFVTGNLPYRVKADEQFPGGVVDINIGTLMRLDLQIVDRDDNPINLTSGTVTVGVRNASTGATVGTDQSATLSLARLGYIYVDTVADWSATAGTYRITVSATLGSDVIVAGPLQLIVRTR